MALTVLFVVGGGWAFYHDGVDLCMDIIREEHRTTLVKSSDGVPTPLDICAVLDDFALCAKRL